MEFKYYNIHYNIDYKNNDEYRSQIQKLFIMEIDYHISDINDVLYDGTAIENGIAFVFNHTKDNILMQKLFEKSAEILMSDNLEMGLAILFSFDYLILFHKLLFIYFIEPTSFTETNPIYIELLNKIKR